MHLYVVWFYRSAFTTWLQQEVVINRKSMVQKRLEVEPVDWLTAEPVVMVPLFSFFSSLGSEVTEEHTEED